MAPVILKKALRVFVVGLVTLLPDFSRSSYTRNNTMKIHGGIIASVVAMLFASTALAQSPNNAVWGVNDQNEVFRYNPSQDTFERMPGTLKQVSVGIDGEVWGVGPNDDPFRWTGSQWQPIQGKLQQLSVRNATEAWGVNADHNLFRWNGSAWEQIPIIATRFVSVGVDGEVWGLSLVPAIIQTINTWVERQTLIALPLPGRPLNQISVTDLNRAWAIDDTGGSFRWAGIEWQPFDISLIDVAEAANGELWRVAQNGLLHFQQNPTAALKNYPNLHFKHIAVGLAGLTDDERQQILDAHNTERQKYPGVGALQWSRELEGYAQEWAQAVASGEKSGHRPDRQNNPFKPGEGLGENMYFSGGSVTGVNAVEWFISEKQWYHYDQDNGRGSFGEPPGCTAPQGQACGHFTQVIWNNTKYVCCGTAISPSNSKWYVCDYYAVGNNGQKPY
jgi:virginiamycin B lyase